jgi:hypothetical protein
MCVYDHATFESCRVILAYIDEFGGSNIVAMYSSITSTGKYLSTSLSGVVCRHI